MPDIVIGGATFPGVPAVDLPKSGGGTARFHDMSDDMAWLGAGVECINSNLFTKEDVLANTNFAHWTPSTTSVTIVSTAGRGPVSVNLGDYTYYVIWDCGINVVYSEDAEKKALEDCCRLYAVQQVFRKPNNVQQFKDANFGTNSMLAVFSTQYMHFYNGGGTETFSIANTAQGFYFTASLPTLISTTNLTTSCTPRNPSLTVRCNTGYFSMANAELVDRQNSNFWIRGKVYRVPRENGIEDSLWREFVRIIHE